MSNLNQTPAANRIHIGFFGRRNAGKSSLVNAVTAQTVSIVSDTKGTTTDPVYKSMELLPLGPVVIIDTPGLDDEGELGEKRVERARRTLAKTDIAVVVADAAIGLTQEDKALIDLLKKRAVPFVSVFNKHDLAPDALLPEDALFTSTLTGEGIEELKERIAALSKPADSDRRILSDLLSPGDMVVLVTPIDASAPKGRMILPQVQTIRDILDKRAMCITVQTEELPQALAALKNPPRLVVTDSQVFGTVKNMVPPEIPLTSFSILFARFKGILETAVRGAAVLDTLPEGANILICEGCTHHRQCEDIGTVKLPGWIRRHTGKDFAFHFTSGGEFPEDLSGYQLIVHCGGCMLNEKEMRYRLLTSQDSRIPFTNYGTLIAYMNGILRRSLEFFPDLAAIIPE